MRSASIRSALLLAVYAAVVITLQCFHEVWCDEVHTLNSVLESRSYFDLFRQIRNEGHPAVWHSIVYFFHWIIPHPICLKTASFFVALTAAFILVRFAPFSLFEKACILFGYYPLYEYSVISRNYGISMMLFYAWIALVLSPRKKRFVAAIVLFVLANTNAYSTVLCAALLLAAAVDDPWRDKTTLTVIAAGIALAVLQMLPDPTSVVKGMSAAAQLVHPAQVFQSSAPGGSPMLTGLIIANRALSVIVTGLFGFYFLNRSRFWAAFFFFSTVGLTLFFSLICAPKMRHIGVFFLLSIGAFWIDRANSGSSALADPVRSEPAWIARIGALRRPALVLFLALQLVLGGITSFTEVTSRYSSSRAFAELIRSRADLRNAVLIGEPDLDLESMPYYVQNLRFIPRENRWGRNIRLTRVNKEVLSLGEMMASARQIRAESGSPVLITLGHTLRPEGPYVIPSYYGKSFVYTPEDLKVFEKETVGLASFGGSESGEDYTVHLLR